MTEIGWTHFPGYRGESWNPVVGCREESPGCKNCYAAEFAARVLDGNPNTPHYCGTTRVVKGKAVWTGKVARAPEKTLFKPLRATRPTCYFVNSMGDLFEPSVPDHWINDVFEVMGAAEERGHIFIILTKHAARMRAYMTRCAAPEWNRRRAGPDAFPPRNVILGVSAEDQRRANERIPELIATPAALRMLSLEPLLGPVDLSEWIYPGCPIGWAVLGGESGKRARVLHPEWEADIRRVCDAAGVPYFRKQWGEWLWSGAENGQIRYGRHEMRRLGSAISIPPVCVYRVGKGRAGSALKGVEHQAFPVFPRHPATAGAHP